MSFVRMISLIIIASAFPLKASFGESPCLSLSPSEDDRYYNWQDDEVEDTPYGYDVKLLRRNNYLEHQSLACNLEHIKALYADAVAAYNAEAFDDGLPLAEQATQIAYTNVGPEERITATLMNTLGSFYFKLGRYAESEEVWEHALAVKQRLLGDDHEETVLIAENLALLAEAQDR